MTARKQMKAAGEKPTASDMSQVDASRQVELLKAQTASQMWSLLLARGTREEVEFPAFRDLLIVYEEGFPKLLELNRRLLHGGEDTK